MRRLLAIMLGMIMIFALAGCGGNNNNGGSADNRTADNNGGQTSDVAQMTVIIDIDYPDAGLDVVCRLHSLFNTYDVSAGSLSCVIHLLNNSFCLA